MKGWLRQAGAFLVCIIMIANDGEAKFINGFYRTPGHTGAQGLNIDEATKLCCSRFPESIPVCDDDKKVVPLIIIQSAILCSRAPEKFVVWPQCKWVFMFFPDLGCFDYKIGRQWMRHDSEFAKTANLMSRSLSGIGCHITYCKRASITALLQGQGQLVRFDEYISTQLSLGGILCAAYQTSGGPPQESGEYPKSACSNNQGTGKPSHPPVGIRIPLAIILGLGSNGVLAWGILNLNDKRQIRGAGLIGLGVAMFLSGIGLMLTLGFPGTWGWWV